MVSVTFVSDDGKVRVVDAELGLSLMTVARNGNVPNIDADCGGACSCATCQVFVDPAWLDATGKISEEEEAMLDLAIERQPTSRLSCQIRVTEALDGLRVAVPKSQF